MRTMQRRRAPRRTAWMVAVAFAMSIVGVFAMAPAAMADYADCPSTYFCVWTQSTGTGSRYQYASLTNPVITLRTVRSGYDRSVTGRRACAWSGTNYTGTLQISEAPGATSSFTARSIQSTQFTYLLCSDI